MLNILGGECPEVEKMSETGVKEQLEKAIKQAVEEAKKTGRPQGIELMRNEHYAFQLLITPPGEVPYGAVTVKREHPSVLMSIRSTRLWRNNLTIPSFEHFVALKQLIEAIDNDKELMEAVREVVTPTTVSAPIRTIKINK